jgi:hypothetical protein
MTYHGTILNGVVVFNGKDRPAEGTQVEVQPVDATQSSGNGSARQTLDDIARRQGVTRPAAFDELLGGWPDGEMDDGFEDAVEKWRAEEPRRVGF